MPARCGVSQNMQTKGQVGKDSWNGLFDTQVGPAARVSHLSGKRPLSEVEPGLVELHDVTGLLTAVWKVCNKGYRFSVTLLIPQDFPRQVSLRSVGHAPLRGHHKPRSRVPEGKDA
jgi:hypothetical protein